MAEEARAIAMRTRDPAAKETMLEIAADYDRLAKKSQELARRSGGKGKPKSDWGIGGGSMLDKEEHRPGDRAPATARYEELNVFVTPTGAVIRVHEGDPLPAAPRSFTWRRVWREQD